MLVHRFRELFEATEPIPATTPAGHAAAFVPCPMAFAMSPVHQAQVEYLYRLAFEQAQAEVARGRRLRWPGYSLN